MTAIATFLDTKMAWLDHGLLRFMHFLAEKAGGLLTPLAKIFTFIGEKGILFLLIAVLLLLAPKNRKQGVALFGAIACAFLISNLVLKDAVCRMRPFEAFPEYARWWLDAGAVSESGFSFPSGHASGAMAGIMALWYQQRKKRYKAIGFVYVFLICVSRMYLMAHYPTDILAGLLVGWLSAYVACYITEVIWILLEKHPDGRLSQFAAHWDLRKTKGYQNLLKSRKKSAKTR